MGELLRPTLDASVYLDESVWLAERNRIWFDQWVLVGRTEDITRPGDRLLVDLAGESVLVVRGDHDQLHAFYNVCRHRGAELVDPAGPPCGNVGTTIRCPYHAWSYAYDGTLRRGRGVVCEHQRASCGASDGLPSVW